MINISYSRLFRSERLEPARIREELSRQTFGQEGAVAEIVTAITLFSQQDNEPEHRKLLLLPFIGWVGVGKVAQNREIKIGLENIFIPDTHSHHPLPPPALPAEHQLHFLFSHLPGSHQENPRENPPDLRLRPGGAGRLRPGGRDGGGVRLQPGGGAGQDSGE